MLTLYACHHGLVPIRLYAVMEIVFSVDHVVVDPPCALGRPSQERQHVGLHAQRQPHVGFSRMTTCATAGGRGDTAKLLLCRSDVFAEVSRGVVNMPHVRSLPHY